jgi:valyl-tRNA synthetase
MPTLKCPQKPKKKPTEKLLNWDAHYVGISALRERQRNSITLEEVVDEAIRLLSPSAPIITEDQIPQFMAWDANDLTGSLAYLKSSYLSKPWS